MVYKEEKVNKEMPDGNLQVELAISMSCAPSKSYLLFCGYRTDTLVEAQHILPAGFWWLRDFTFLNSRRCTHLDSAASTGNIKSPESHHCNSVSYRMCIFRALS